MAVARRGSCPKRRRSRRGLREEDEDAEMRLEEGTRGMLAAAIDGSPREEGSAEPPPALSLPVLSPSDDDVVAAAGPEPRPLPEDPLPQIRYCNSGSCGEEEAWRRDTPPLCAGSNVEAGAEVKAARRWPLSLCWDAASSTETLPLVDPADSGGRGWHLSPAEPIVFHRPRLSPAASIVFRRRMLSPSSAASSAASSRQRKVCMSPLPFTSTPPVACKSVISV